MKYEKLKKILLVTIFSLLTLLLIIAVTFGVIGGTYAYREYKKENLRKKEFIEYQDSVWVFNLFSYKCKGRVKFKPNPEKKAISYLCNTDADSGLSFSDNSGKVFIKFKDKEGFVISEFSPNDFTTIKDKRDRAVRREYSGEWYEDVKILIKTNLIEVSNSYNFKSHLSRPKNKSVHRTTQFDKDLDDWTKKTEAIKIGMTYEQMVSVAGRPRTSSYLSSNEYGYNYDLRKYNYGRKLIYFKDNLVYKIK